MYVKFPGKLVTCISYANYVYRTKSDKRCIHVGFFFFLFDIFLRFVCFVLYLFVFDNRLIYNFISFFSVLRI
jgi:hypothetical protein